MVSPGLPATAARADSAQPVRPAAEEVAATSEAEEALAALPAICPPQVVAVDHHSMRPGSGTRKVFALATAR